MKTANANTGAKVKVELFDDPVAEILQRLRDYRKNNDGGFTACCPAHEDASPSLSVNRGDDGKALLSCHAGCTYDDIMKAIGMDPCQGFSRNGNNHKPTKGNSKSKGKSVLSFDTLEDLEKHYVAMWHGQKPTPFYYQDQTGKVVLAAFKFIAKDGKKAFMPGRLSSDGKWQNAALEADRPPYRLPELAEAETVWIVEGEKCADHVISTLELTATTSFGGSQAPRKTNWQPLAKAKHIRIIPDCDEAGMKYALAVAELVRRVNSTAEIKVVNLPGLEEGEDVFDWHKDADPSSNKQKLLQDLVNSAPVYGHEEATQTESPGYQFQTIDSHTFFTSDYQAKWLIGGLLVANQPAVIGGPKKALKTTVALDLVISLASGTKALGRFDTFGKMPVVMISAESGKASLQDAGKRICKAKSIDPLKALDLLHWSFEMPQLCNPLHVAEMVKALETIGTEGVVTIDPLYLGLLAGGNLKEIEAGNLYSIGPALYELANAILSARWTPILLHHARKHTDRDMRPLELDDLSFAGIAEFARQWLLLSRREAYSNDGQHKLWLSAGGSIGHSAKYGLDIGEGVVQVMPGNPFISFIGRSWSVEVLEADQVATPNSKDRKDKMRLQAEKDHETKFLNTLDLVDPERLGASETKIRDTMGVSGTVVKETAERLHGEDFIEPVQSPKKNVRLWKRKSRV